MVTLVRQQRFWRPLRQGDQGVKRLAIRRFANRQVEGEWPSSGISQAVKLTGESAPRAAKSIVDASPFSARRRNMSTNRGVVDAVVAAVDHDLSERNRNGLPDPGFAPTPKPPVDRIPVAVFGRNITPRRAAPKPPKYSVDDRSALLGSLASPSVCRLNRQQIHQNAPFCFTQIAPAQARLQKEALNQADRTVSTNSSTPPRVPSGFLRCCCSWAVSQGAPGFYALRVAVPPSRRCHLGLR